MQRTRVLFPAPTWWLIVMSNSSYRFKRSSTLFCCFCCSALLEEDADTHLLSWSSLDSRSYFLLSYRPPPLGCCKEYRAGGPRYYRHRLDLGCMTLQRGKIHYISTRKRNIAKIFILFRKLWTRYLIETWLQWGGLRPEARCSPETQTLRPRQDD